MRKENVWCYWRKFLKPDQFVFCELVDDTICYGIINTGQGAHQDLQRTALSFRYFLAGNRNQEIQKLLGPEDFAEIKNTILTILSGKGQALKQQSLPKAMRHPFQEVLCA